LFLDRDSALLAEQSVNRITMILAAVGVLEYWSTGVLEYWQSPRFVFWGCGKRGNYFKVVLVKSIAKFNEDRRIP